MRTHFAAASIVRVHNQTERQIRCSQISLWFLMLALAIRSHYRFYARDHCARGNFIKYLALIKSDCEYINLIRLFRNCTHISRICLNYLPFFIEICAHRAYMYFFSVFVPAHRTCSCTHIVSTICHRLAVPIQMSCIVHDTI